MRFACVTPKKYLLPLQPKTQKESFLPTRQSHPPPLTTSNFLPFFLQQRQCPSSYRLLCSHYNKLSQKGLVLIDEVETTTINVPLFFCLSLSLSLPPLLTPQKVIDP
jgi:hypothetical protein